MCGITGAFSLQGASIARDWLEKATHALSKRGPDNQSIHFENYCGLGHARLSIIDTSEAANQPFWDPTGRYGIVFNGEIFNFLELKKELSEKGISFHTSSDTEVLLQLLILYGEQGLSKLNGFFAFAFLDKKEESLLIVRDRFGIKPLIFYKSDDFFFFASEMKSLLHYPLPRDMDWETVAMYFQLNYIPNPYSIFKNVQKLSPGHYLKISKTKFEIQPFYEVPYNEDIVNTNTFSYERQQTRLRELMEDAVRIRLISDVPLGAFLSGGIDSSVIVGLASRHTTKLNTFSIGFEDNAFFDETEYANLVAKHFNTNHTVFKLKNTDLLESLNSLLEYIDEPFADSSALLVNLLSKYTRQHVTVALSGDGGDEIFAGYNKHYGEWKMRQGGIDTKTVALLKPLWQVLPKSRNGKIANKIRQLERFAIGFNLSEQERYWRWCSLLEESEVEKLLEKPVSRNITNQRKSNIIAPIHKGGSFNECLLADVKLLLPGDMLTKVDLMSMANSLEVRVPFLDYRVVDFAFSLPVSSKINGQLKKRIVQDAFREMLPKELYNRPKKGFEVPLLPWFRKELKSLIMDDLLEDNFIKEQGIFNLEYIKAAKNKIFSNNPGDIHTLIWALIVFQSWYKKYLC